MVRRGGDKEVERAPHALVIDASATIKWFVPEDDTEKAVRLRRKHIEGQIDLFAPDLLVYEVANALRYRPDLTEEALKEDVSALFALDLELVVPSSDIIAKAAARARELGVTVYDSIYLALAETIGSYVVTADERLYERAERTRLVWLLRDLDEKWMV